MSLKTVPLVILVFLSAGGSSWSDQPTTLFDRYSRSVEAIIGTVDKPTNYRKMILDNLSGDWFRISAVAPEKNDPAQFARMCDPKALASITINVLNDYAFEAVNAKGGSMSLSTVYTSRAGNQFGTYTDVTVLFERMGGGTDITSNPGYSRMIDKVLHDNNGTVSIVRPYDDILVLQSPETPLDVWARCPKP
ncbi:hypothetical protein [Agrobacterium tumefaciens]|uniref:hypothetical protein n=1 Tax=Agrobacterium tumefaciens TaxID=358 RepID=UPI00287E11E6|nr:hypothetical protein [Agrobacterium tumefaciens]MDS7597851.1 hypothetical protein [Agrobacterium tumefaciens]